MINVTQHMVSRRLTPRVEALLSAACAGARAILATVDHNLQRKRDGSPVTDADLASERAIVKALSQSLPELPIVSEESDLPDIGADAPFLLVDPLDGTKEFAEGRTDYAVLISLIENARPVAGVILAPAERMAWIADEAAFAVPLDHAMQPRWSEIEPLPPLVAGNTVAAIVVSRSHGDPVTDGLIERYPAAKTIPLGSALKFVAIARGEADLYPRGTGPMIWDVAAGDALIHAVGGDMRSVSCEKLAYVAKSDRLRNGPFVAAASQGFVVECLAQWPAN